MIAVADNLAKCIPDIIVIGLMVFAITWTSNKSKLFASKKEFVQKRYESAKVGGSPGHIHYFWFSMWICAMCFGFWISLGICLYYPLESYFWPTQLGAYGLNIMFQTTEDLLVALTRRSTE